MKPMTEEERIEKVMGKKQLPAGAKTKGNELFVIHNLDLLSFAPIDCKIETAEVIDRRCYDYMEKCIQNEMKPGIAGLALAIGVGRPTLINYINGNVDMPHENRAVLQRYYTFLNAILEDYTQNGKINPVSALFLLKNNFGYKDTQEFVVNNNVQEETTPESLIEEANLLFDNEPKMANIEE